ncbi:hypothetical protein LTR16_012530, partial [Cryomyces antarcticus]
GCREGGGGSGRRSDVHDDVCRGWRRSSRRERRRGCWWRQRWTRERGRLEGGGREIRERVEGSGDGGGVRRGPI